MILRKFSAPVEEKLCKFVKFSGALNAVTSMNSLHRLATGSAVLHCLGKLTCTTVAHGTHGLIFSYDVAICYGSCCDLG